MHALADGTGRKDTDPRDFHRLLCVGGERRHEEAEGESENKDC